MKIICAPDSFKGSLTAVDAAKAMADGIRNALPDAEIDYCPVGDGGEGTQAALIEALGGWTFSFRVRGMLGGGIDVRVGQFHNGNFAYIETAMAIGPDSSPDGARDVMAASTFGVGELIERACINSPQRLLVGVGGSDTNDGGCGMAQALGVQFFDASGRVIEVPISGGSLQQISRIDRSQFSRVVSAVPIVVICDVYNPLTGPEGASEIFGPQKGASPADVAKLDEGLRHVAAIIRRDLGIDVEAMPGAGAAGGLGAGLSAFAGAKIVSGIETILAVVDFDTRVQDADLCLTGEGRLDSQSMSGKTCIGVATAAASAGVPVVALVGSTGPGADQCLDAGLDEYVAIGEGLPIEESIRNASTLLAAAAARVARKYSEKSATIGRSVRESDK